MAGSFAFEGPYNFVVEGHCCNSSIPAVAPGIHCLSILAGHVPDNQEAVVVGTTGIAPVVGVLLAALTIPGTALVSLDTDTPTGIELAAPTSDPLTCIARGLLLAPSFELQEW